MKVERCLERLVLAFYWNVVYGESGLIVVIDCCSLTIVENRVYRGGVQHVPRVGHALEVSTVDEQ